MAATIVPLLTLAVIAFVLIVAIAPSRKATAPEALSEGEKNVRAYGLILRDKLDRALFGPVLAEQVWRKLMRCPIGEGLIHEFHRDFCGHGLIRTEAGVKLCDILDGWHPGEAIAEWTSQEAFIAFFAEQSDYSCSGWDETSPVFATQDEWHRNNQRLTRKKLQRFLDGSPPA
ncbi:hypothetical protein [Bosea sp. (in: a-proteobacteria)]|jgi:hypothetical protein|uniref:hypothetical protein n=1 Tax=Bosea sp. (in: a-proteobacteria) TaxID=1871050 RepID=UPI003F725F63